MATMPPAAGPPTIGPVPPLGLPSWHELYRSADHVFSAPVIPYVVLLAALFNSMDPPDTLLTRLKRTSLESPVTVALIADEAPDWISLVKNPHQFVGSLLNPLILDGLVYRFTGPDAHSLAAVHILTSAFEMTAAYNVLDDPATVCGGLETLLADQMFHPYVNVGMP